MRWPLLVVALLIIFTPVLAADQILEDKVPVLIYLNSKNIETASTSSNLASSLENADFEIDPEYTFTTISAIYTHLTEKQIEELSKLKEIKIYRDELKYKIALSEAAPFVGANYIWNISISGLNITGENYSVCIVDTGVNSSHPALLNKIIAQMDFCADNSNCITNDTVAEDANGHGTHVAGIIASQDSYSKGIAPGANLVIAKAFNSSGSGSDSTILKALEWCISNSEIYNISVISMSWGSGGPFNSSNTDDCLTFSQLITNMLKTASDKNITLVAAAGNENWNNGIMYPACLSNVISVSASARNSDQIASFSSVGDLLGILAPGVNINSTSKNGNWITMSGTSMSTPFVSGAAILLSQYNKLRYGLDLTPTEIKQKLLKSRFEITKANITVPRLYLPDSFAPIDIVSPQNTTYGNTSLNFNITTDSNVYAANLTINNIYNYSLVNYTEKDWYATVNTSDLGEGTFNATFNIFGDLNNSKSIVFSLDLTGPNIILNSPSNDSEIAPKTLINLTIQDLSNVSNAWYSLDNGNNISIPYINGYYLINTENWTKGVWGVYVWANDSIGNLNNSSFTFEVNNSLPIWNMSKFFSVNEDSEISFYLNASDPDNEPINYLALSLPQHAILNSTTGLFNWTPRDENVGNTSITFRAYDPYDYSELNITIEVNNTNDPPTILPINDQEANVDEEFILYVYATDPDLDSNDNLIFSDNTSLFDIQKINQNSTHAKAKIEFTPSENDVGTHKIKITVKDLENETDSEIFTLRINGVTDGGGARGGGLSSSIYSNWSFSKSWLNLKAGSPISFEVFISDLPITYMTLFPTATSSNAAIGIRKVSKPVNVETPDYPLTYFEISKTNLALAYAKLKFKISKSWKSQNYIEQIYLAKLQGNDWLKQPLVLVSENLNEEEYEATLNTFSLFVIAGVQNIPIMANASLETDGGKNISLQNISLTQQNEGKKDFANFTNIVIFLSVLFGLFILISAIILKQYRNKPKAKPIIIQTKESVDFDF